MNKWGEMFQEAKQLLTELLVEIRALREELIRHRVGK